MTRFADHNSRSQLAHLSRTMILQTSTRAAACFAAYSIKLEMLTKWQLLKHPQTAADLVFATEMGAAHTLEPTSVLLICIVRWAMLICDPLLTRPARSLS